MVRIPYVGRVGRFACLYVLSSCIIHERKVNGSPSTRLPSSSALCLLRRQVKYNASSTCASALLQVASGKLHKESAFALSRWGQLTNWVFRMISSDWGPSKSANQHHNQNHNRKHNQQRQRCSSSRLRSVHPRPHPTSRPGSHSKLIGYHTIVIILCHLDGTWHAIYPVVKHGPKRNAYLEIKSVVMTLLWIMRNWSYNIGCSKTN